MTNNWPFTNSHEPLYCIGVVAHDNRYDHAENLASKTQAITVNYDNGELGCAANHRIVWETLSHNNTEWCLVLEDDAMPVRDFHNQLRHALHNSPTDVLSLYLGRHRPPQWQNRIHEAITHAQAADACYIIGPTLLHAVAVAIKTTLIPDMLQSTRHTTKDMAIDSAIGYWARIAQHRIAYTNPSLCNHNDTLPSLAKHKDMTPRTAGRTAWNIGTRDHWMRTTIAMYDPTNPLMAGR